MGLDPAGRNSARNRDTSKLGNPRAPGGAQRDRFGRVTSALSFQSTRGASCPSLVESLLYRNGIGLISPSVINSPTLLPEAMPRTKNSPARSIYLIEK
jgi:hypothetical protein